MKFRTTALVRLDPGTALELTKEQASARAHLLDKRGSKFVALAPLEFKAGEVIGLVNPPKSLLASLQKIEAEG